MKHNLMQCLLYSIGVHMLLILSFSNYTGLFVESPENLEGIDSLEEDGLNLVDFNFDFFETLLSPLLDSTTIDSLWKTDSVSLKALSVHSLSKKVLSPLSPSPQYSMHSRPWYKTDEERAEALEHMLSKFRPSSGLDSLFASSEYLRKSVLKHIEKNLSNRKFNTQLDRSDWKEILNNVSEFLKQKYAFSKPDTSQHSPINAGFLSKLFNDPDLLKMWKESVHFSLQENALERMREAMHQAVKTALDDCGLNQNGRGAKKSSSTAKGNLSAGKKGVGSLSTEELSHCFETAFSQALQSLGTMGLAQMASLFEKDALYEQLSKEAQFAFFQMSSGSNALESMVNTVDFAGTIKESFDGFSVDERKASQIQNFLETMRMGLGKDIDNWLQQGPSKKDLLNNPYYYSEWARNYWDLINRIQSTPNLLMPNFETYAEAVKKIRDRYVTSETRLLFQGGILKKQKKEQRMVPEKVFLPRKPQGSKKPSSVIPLEEPDFNSHGWGGALRVEKPISIDGYLSEWEQVKPYTLYGKPVGLEHLPTDYKFNNRVWVQWDNQGLYIAYRLYDVQDNAYHKDVFWNTDALEMFFDPFNLKDSYRVAGRSYQFWIWPRVKPGEPGAGQSQFTSPSSFQPMLLQKDVIPFASVRKSNTYTCEAFIPASLFKGWYPLPGKIIGFNFSLNNGEGLYIRWITNMGKNVSLHPNLWGDLLLMGSNATIRVNPDSYILPGQKVDITITDYDMNLKGYEKDKIWVKVRADRTGDVIPLALLETENNSGIFQTQLGTIFAAKPKIKESLSVLNGDQITIYYLDQHSRGGKKNNPLLYKLDVVRGIFSFRKN